MTDPKTEKTPGKPLDPMAHHVLREGGTERAFTGKYTDHKVNGVYRFTVCGAPLFVHRTKYDSGAGGPVSTATARDRAVRETCVSRPCTDPNEQIRRTPCTERVGAEV